MKRILLVIAIALCVGVAATALAFQFNDATPVSGTLTTDSVFVMTLNSTASASIRLTPGVESVYPLVCSFEGSASAPKSGVGNLTITMADTIVFSMHLITVTVYSDAGCTQPIAGKTQTGAGTITISNISSQTTYYIGVFVPTGLADTTGIGGSIKLAFNKVG